MICPQCKARVPAKALWKPGAASRVVCPQCNASLCPTAACAIILFVLSLGLGEGVLIALRSYGVSLELGLIGFFVVFAGAYCLATPLVVKLRHLDDAVPSRDSHRPAA